MKKIISCVAVAMTIASASAQITVSSDGRALFGQTTPESLTVTPARELGLIPNPVTTVGDTTASAVFFDRNYSSNAAHISFGSGVRVSIGELPNSTGKTTDVLQLKGLKGFVGDVEKGRVFSYDHHPSLGVSSGLTPFVFNTDVKANGILLTSDSRLKANVKGIESAVSVLEQISPISYTLVSQTIERQAKLSEVAADADMSNEVKPLAPDPRTRYGFMAQEIKEVLPDLVVEDEDGTMAIDYIGFIPILVDAVKSLRAEVEEQRDEIAALTGSQRRAAPSSVTAKAELISSGAVLAQNSPNPFSSSTVIKCNIPEGVSESSIFIYDLQGKQIARMAIAERGDTSVTVEASSLQPGMYIYTLVADGVEIDSKRMILTD